MPKCCDITKNRTACYKTAVLGSTRCKKHTDFFNQAGPPVEGKCAMYIEPSPYIEIARRCEKGVEEDGFCAWHQPIPEQCPHNYPWPRHCHECRVITSRRQEELDRLGTKNGE
jgi:hypothetical protein